MIGAIRLLVFAFRRMFTRLIPSCNSLESADMKGIELFIELNCGSRSEL